MTWHSRVYKYLEQRSASDAKYATVKRVKIVAHPGSWLNPWLVDITPLMDKDIEELGSEFIPLIKAHFMGKSLFANRIANVEVVDMEMAVDEAYNLIEGRFPDGSFVLPYGDSIGVNWKDGEKPYKATRVLTFDSFGMPDSDDVMAYSVMSYSSYGDKDRMNPLHIEGTRMSRKNHLIPDADLVASEMPLRLEMVRTGNKVTLPNGEVKDAVKVRPHKMQVLKVVGHKYILVAEYDNNGDVVMTQAQDAHGALLTNEDGSPKMVCKLRAKQKPVFQLMNVNELPDPLKKALRSEDVKSRFGL